MRSGACQVGRLWGLREDRISDSRWFCFVSFLGKGMLRTPVLQGVCANTHCVVYRLSLPLSSATYYLAGGGNEIDAIRLSVSCQ